MLVRSVNCLPIFVPEDETCFVLLQAHSAEAAGEAARRAGLRFERVAEAVGESRSVPEPKEGQ